MGEQCPLRVLWDPAFDRYDFGPGHPFTETSRWMAVRLLEANGFFDSHDLKAPQRLSDIAPASREDLRRFHREDYLARVERAGEGRTGVPLDAGDTPSFPGCYGAASAIVGGTLAAIRIVQEHPSVHAFSPAGGLHHAHPGRASGFCIFNDLAVGLKAFQTALDSGHRVAYIDIDVHHGDGVMYGFYEDGQLLN